MNADRIRRNRVRRDILAFLYGKYQEDPLCPVMLLDVAAALSEPREAVIPHLRYMESSGLLKVAWNLSGTGLIRIQKDGLDAAEDPGIAGRLFPLSGAAGDAPLTRAGGEILRAIDARADLPLRDRLFLREIAAEFYAALVRLHEAGHDFAKLFAHFENLRAALPELDADLRESLRREAAE